MIMDSTNNPVITSTADIIEACELADSIIETEDFNFHHVARLAIWALENMSADQLRQSNPQFDVYTAEDICVTSEDLKALAHYRTQRGRGNVASPAELRTLVDGIVGSFVPATEPPPIPEPLEQREWRSQVNDGHTTASYADWMANRR